MTDNQKSSGRRTRIEEYVIRRIVGGEWKPGDRIPSESALTGIFGVSRMTVHHALRDLTARGFLIRRSGSGTFVAEPSAYVAEYAHLDVIEEITAKGGCYRAQVLRRDLRPATQAEAELFDVTDEEPVFHAVVLHFDGDTPFELEDRLIAPRFLPDAMAIDLTAQTLFSRLMVVRPYRQGSETVRAIMGTPDQRELLRAPTDEPCLEITRRTWSPEGVVTVATMVRAGSHAMLQGGIRSLNVGN